MLTIDSSQFDHEVKQAQITKTGGVTMTEERREKKERRSRRNLEMRQTLIIEAMLEKGFDTHDIVTNDLERFAYLLKNNEKWTIRKEVKP